MYAQKGSNVTLSDTDSAENVDAELEKELEDLRQSAHEEHFTSIKLDTPCGQSSGFALPFRSHFVSP